MRRKTTVAAVNRCFKPRGLDGWVDNGNEVHLHHGILFSCYKKPKL